MTDQPNTAERVEIDTSKNIDRDTAMELFANFRDISRVIDLEAPLWGAELTSAVQAAIKAARDQALRETIANLPYQTIFNAIGAAVHVSGGNAVGISVAEFKRALIGTPAPAARPVVDREALRDMVAKAVFDTGDDVPLGRPARLAADRILVVLAKAGALITEPGR